MDRGIISTRYAKALLSFSIEKGVEDDVYIQTKSLLKSLNEVPELEMYLSSPVISHEDKILMIKTAVGGKITDDFERFLKLVLLNKREYFLCYIVLKYNTLYYKAKNISICNLVTSIPISDDVEEKIKCLISDKTHGLVELKKSINPDIIGGFIFEFNFNRLDASVATQINSIKKQILEINNKY
ncbi:MAG: F0F1 ATP synthase subunit delta [Bacteroidales bacterium]